MGACPVDPGPGRSASIFPSWESGWMEPARWHKNCLISSSRVVNACRARGSTDPWCGSRLVFLAIAALGIRSRVGIYFCPNGEDFRGIIDRFAA